MNKESLAEHWLYDWKGRSELIRQHRNFFYLIEQDTDLKNIAGFSFFLKHWFTQHIERIDAEMLGEFRRRFG